MQVSATMLPSCCCCQVTLATADSHLALLAGNVVTLSFGALAINDILAAVLTLVFYETVTHLFYTAEKKTLRLWFANCFKIGVVAAMVADALKLQV